MTKFGRSVLAASTLVLMSTAGAYAADLNGGSIKDSGYMPPMASRAAALYLRGDFSAGSTEFGSITEPPAYTHSDARISSSRFGGGGIGYYFSPSVRGDLTLDGSNTASARGTILDGVATLQGERRFGVRHLVGLANLYYWIDRQNGIGGFWATQILPFADPASVGAYLDFETAAYASMKEHAAA